MKEQWQQIHNVMERYGRKEGYVDEVDGKLQFFDGDPRRGGISACLVTIEQVKNIIKAEEVREHLAQYVKQLEQDGFYLHSARFKRDENTGEIESILLSYDEN